MCLSIVVRYPHRLLSQGEHLGFEWMTVHNENGYRCGYVRVPPGHPWHGKHYDAIEAECHGGMTFAEADLDCGKGGPDNAWWLGFDCAHGWDAPDPALPQTAFPSELLALRALLNNPIGDAEVRTQEYVEAQCRSLCEQAEAAR